MHLALSVVCLGMLFALPAWSLVVNPRVTTDASIDTFSAETVVRQIVQPGMTDEQKAVACWRFMLDHFYHWTPPREPDTSPDVRDFAKAINTYGYGPCFVAAPVLSALWEAAGLETRSWTITGHSIPEVKYGGAWHMLDADARAFHRTSDGRIAGVEALSRDSKLHTDPSAPSNPFYPFGKPDQVVKPFVFWGPPSRMMDLYLSRKNNYRYNRRAVMGHPMYLSLRQGETLALNHANRGKFVVPPKMKPEFIDGGPKEVKGRYTYGNGTLVWRPDLKKIPARRLLWLGSKNVKITGGRIVPEAAGKPAAAVFRIWCPYALVEARASLSVIAQTQPSVDISFDGGAAWNPLEAGRWESGKGGLLSATFDLSGHTAGRYEYLLRVTFEQGAVAAVTFDNVFQLSQLALPRLKVGPNRVRVLRGPEEGVVQLVRAKGKPIKKRYLVKSEGLDERAVRPARRDGSSAFAVYRLRAPAPLTALSVGANMTMDRGRPQKIETHYSLDGGAHWTGIWKISDNRNDQNSQFEMDRRVELENPSGAREVLIKFDMARRSKYFGVNEIRLYAFYRQPQPAGAQLAVTFAWQEQDAQRWIDKKKSVIVNRFPYEFTIDCGGEARVRRIEMNPAP